MQLTSDQAADRLGITGGALRQIETNTKPVSLQLAYRAEELFKAVDAEVTISDLIVDQDRRIDEPKVERPAPTKRRHRTSNARAEDTAPAVGAA
jgi:transcriptional regulator with XRE-family HTH domain